MVGMRGLPAGVPSGLGMVAGHPKDHEPPADEPAIHGATWW